MNTIPKLLLIIRGNNKKTDMTIANHNGLSHAAKATYESLLNSSLNVDFHVVADNNDIWAGCEKYNPDYVIVDGLWVVPEKFNELSNIYPNIKWIVRIHSELSFVAQEGIFTDWLYKYLNTPNTYVVFNSKKIYKTVKNIVKPKQGKVFYLPNLYQLNNKPLLKKERDSKKIKIAIFGAARILKNQLPQAVAALDFAERINKELELYININTKDPNGLPIYLNIIHLIKNHYSGRHNVQLVEWTNHETFLKIMGNVDICMQVSFTETFNLVCCDSLEANTPIIGMKEIPWLHSISNSDPVNHKSIINALFRAYNFPRLNVLLNTINLKRYHNKAIKIWENLFNRQLRNLK